jgi:peptide/nickel transport system substrate-binding protein
VSATRPDRRRPGPSRRGRRRALALALIARAAAAAAAAGGCDGTPIDRLRGDSLGGGATARVPSLRGVGHDPDTVIVGRPRDATSLDPALVTDNESVEVTQQIHETLVRFRPGSNRIEPGLATAWTVSEGGRVWTFQLRRGVRFHDGTPFDARAVVFSLERQRDALHPRHRADFGYWNNLYRNIHGIEAVDEFTVRIAIEQPYAPFEANMAMFPVAIVSPAAVEVWGDAYGEHPVGTGPFRFAAWDKGERIVLERNPDHWDGPPAMARLVFQAIPDGRQRLIALEGGAIDLAYSILPEELQFVELHPDLRLHTTPANNVAYLAMNTTHAPFDDVRVRRAANYAVDKEPIVKLIYQGQAIAADGPLPPTQWGYAPLDVPYRHDPARARELLAAAAADGAFDPDAIHALYVPSDPRPYLPEPEAVARVLQAHLAAVGIRTRLVVQPFQAHLADVQSGAHDLCLLGWVGDNGDPDNFLYVLFDRDNTTPGIARNVAFFRDAELHGLLAWAQQSSRREEREDYYARAQALIHEAAPWVPIAHSQVRVAARRDLGGLVITPTNQVHYHAVRRGR